MAGQRREEGRQRIVPNIDQGTSRVSRAAGRMSSQSGQHARINLETSGSSARQSTRSRASSQQSQKGKAGARRGSTPTRSAPSRSAPTASSTPPDPRDTRFIKWARHKWGGMEPHQRQGFFSVLLLMLALLLFSSLTVFRSEPILNGINKFFITFLGWCAYPFALGLIAFALAQLVEGIGKRRFIRWSMVVGLGIILLLLLVESRLIAGHLAVGVLAEVLVTPLLGWSPVVGHVIVLGLLLVTIVLTFRITFGHLLLVVHFFQRLVGDTQSTTAQQRVEPSPFLGQRPQFSRYTSGRTPTVANSQAIVPRRAGRRLIGDDVTESMGEAEDEDTGVIKFEADFDNDDPRDDINLHKHEISPVRRGQRIPQPLDLEEHIDAVDGASQQVLPFDDVAEPQQRVILKSSTGMEPLAPNPRKAANRVRGAEPVLPPPVITSPWKVADTALLHSPEVVKLQMLGDDTASLARMIQETLRSFRVDAEVREDDISIGPTVVRFGIRPTGKPEMIQDEKSGKMVPVRDAAGNIIYETRTRVSRIMALQNDLALVLEAKTIRMEAPVPGRPYVGVEIPNKNSRLVTLREILESKEFQAASKKSKLALALGRDVAGLVRVGDLTKMPHVLIAGATGAGKCLAYNEPVFLADGRVVKVQALIGETLNVVGIEDTKEMQQVPVPATFTENGVQEVFEIELDNGIVLRRTEEHPLWAAYLDENQHIGHQENGKTVRRTRAIKAGWVNTKDLRVCGNRPNFDGHVILCPLDLQQQGSVSRSDADVVLCAALIAEGGLNSVGKANISGRSMGTPHFTNADVSMVELVGVAAQEYSCQLVLSPSKVKGNVDYYISQIRRSGRESINPIAQLVYDWEINCLATQKTIPQWVFQLPNAQIALFLRVFIDCDGWVSVRDHRSAVSISLANPILVKQIGQLALRLGITGTYTYKDNGFAGAWTWSTCMVSEWQEQVGSLVKAAKLELAVLDQAESRECGATIWNAWRRARPIVGQKFADCPQGYEWRKIVAIRRVIAPTVNIEVHSENHAFVGYAVEHNSVMINTIIASFLTQATPDDIRMLMVDPKMVELSMYNGIPHLLSPVVTEVDKVVPLLKNAISEMERRYRLFSQLGVRNLEGYRKLRLEKFAKGDNSLNNLPAIVIIIDELADLMMAAPEEVEGMICRLAQLARATGIHLVIATQRPSVDVITGLIKANIPTRISFMVSSAVDSRTIIDMGGAERLLGRGDMLYLPADAGRPERIQAAFLADDEAQALVEYWQQQVIEFAAATVKDEVDSNAVTYAAVEPGWEIKDESADEFELDDDLLEKAEEIVREYGRASISLLQRRLRIGYSRAARLIDLLEEHGIIGQAESGGKGREILEGMGHGNGYARHSGDEDGHSLVAEADDIMEEERARNDFLRQQATARSRQPQKPQPLQDDDDSYEDDV